MSKIHVQIVFATDERGILSLCRDFESLDEMITGVQTVALDMSPMADEFVEIEASPH